jgi:hypothetical protein
MSYDHKYFDGCFFLVFVFGGVGSTFNLLLVHTNQLSSFLFFVFT